MSAQESRDLSGETFRELASDETGFMLLSQHLKKHAGINMPNTSKNLSLMAGRISSLLKLHGLQNYKDLHKKIESGDKELEKEFICSLTTNTTHWFRENKHFEILETYIKSLVSQNVSNEIKIWCAASSIGHEPYTLSIVTRESISKSLNSAGLSKKNIQYKILATDIDQEVLQKAASACYTKSQLNGLTDEQIDKYLDNKTGKFSNYFRVKKEIADPVQFAQMNLLSPTFPFKGQFDVIFCRNVFIYFEKEVSAAIVEKMASFVKKGGLLFLGHAEAGVMKSNLFKNVAHAVYERL
jgi:chemotaxis protein methyltransferase CheR